MSGAGTCRTPPRPLAEKGGGGEGPGWHDGLSQYIYMFCFPLRYRVRYSSGSGARFVAAEAPVDQREFLQEGRRVDSVLQLSPGDTWWAPRTVIIFCATRGEKKKEMLMRATAAEAVLSIGRTFF